ncbi:MAG TPA: hypothetical protein VIK74_11045, partial [Parasegetibacter sp.]
MKRCILFSFVSFISCSMLLKGGWEIKHSDELTNSFQDFHHLIISDDDTGFLFGTQSSEDILLKKQFENQNAVVWRTVD